MPNFRKGVCKLCGIHGPIGDECDACEPQGGVGPMIFQDPGCPWCGEEGTEPIFVYSREWQGDSAHGGMVEWEDERCSACERHKGDPWDAGDTKLTEHLETLGDCEEVPF